MKKLYTILSLFFLISFSNAQNPDAFIMTFEVTNQNLDIIIPIVQDNQNNYTIDFGDSVILSNQTGNVSHIYNTAGVYTVTLTGNFGHIRFFDLADSYKLKLKTIEQWGTNQWSSMQLAFMGCANLIINATDNPDLSQVTNMASMFMAATSVNQPLNNWDVSNVTDMNGMFSNATTFNQPLNNWDVSNVTNMSNMFSNASSFNQPLDNWNVSNVTSMIQMFRGTSAFNSSINNWNVSNVTNMSYMFYDATSFNQSINNWDVSNVRNMSYMFFFATSFNNPLDNWNVSNVINMSYMFRGASSFNQPINNWNVSNVGDISRMFSGTYSFNQPINNWNVSNVGDMTNTFNDASSFNQPLNSWNVSSVTQMAGLFSDAVSFNQDINDWNVSNVIQMSNMFKGASSFNKALNNWNVSNVNNMYGIFEGASSFNQPLNNWDVSNVNDMTKMFKGAIAFNQPINNWNVSTVIYMVDMFYNASSFNQPLNNWNFNPNAPINLFGLNTNSSSGFISYSGIDSINYDLLLQRFVTLELQNKRLGAYELKYCNPLLRSYLINDLGWTITGDTLSDDCNHNIVYGNIFLDQNLDGCDTNDIKMDIFFVNANNGTPYYSTLPSNGEYLLTLFEDTYNISLLNVPDYFTVTPNNTIFNFTDVGNYEELNLCISANETIENLNIALIPITQARPGFEATYQLIVQNIGTQTVNDILVSVNFDNTMQSFISAVPSVSSTSNNQLYFEIASLQPFENATINFTMQTFPPPTVNGDDVLNFTATVTPNTNDYTPNDNTFELNQIVVNAYDPNDKQVLQGDEILIEQAGDYLHYVIRFQNTGTASALNVRIEDILHESLNWNTLQMVSSSHDFRAEITENNQLAFIFNNINLPHEAADEEGSNGFVAYKIKPVDGLTVGDFITGNEASIFFDFNLPIITNAVETEIVDQLNINEFNLNNLISIYPNPVNDILNIKVKDNLVVEEVKLINLQGRELLSIKQNLENISLSGLSSGIYLIKFKTNLGTIQSKIIKN